MHKGGNVVIPADRETIYHCPESLPVELWAALVERYNDSQLWTIKKCACNSMSDIEINLIQGT